MRSFLPLRWPLILRVPLFVAALMLCVSIAVSFHVMSRLDKTQIRHLNALSSAYLDGISSAVMPHILRDDTWEVFDNLERSKDLYGALAVIATIVARPDGTIVASSDPRHFPAESDLHRTLLARDGGALRDGGHTLTWVARDLQFQGRDVGKLVAAIDTSEIRRERREVLMALFATNALLTCLLAAGGGLLVRRMLGPINELSRRLRVGASGTLSPIASAEIGDRSTEIGQLFSRYNELARALDEREALAARLAEEERLASLGRLSTAIAHEINNPLGGLLNAVDTLRRRGDSPAVRTAAIGLLERGLHGIRSVVETGLAMYRPDRNRRPLRAADLDDLRLLVEGEAKRREVSLRWANALPQETTLPSGPLRQALLNLLLNACQATPAGGAVAVEACVENGCARFRVSDGGAGLDAAYLNYLTSLDGGDAPPAGGGIGLWMVRRHVREMNGSVRVETPSAGGTVIELRVPENIETMSHVA